MEINNLPDNSKHWNKNSNWIREKNRWTQNFNKEFENIKKEPVRTNTIQRIQEQYNTKNTIAEIKNTLEGINSGLGDTEEYINYLEDRIIEIIQSEHQTERQMKKSESSIEIYGII